MLENKKSLIILISAVSIGVCAFILYIFFSNKAPNDVNLSDKPEFRGILVDKNSQKIPEFSGRDEVITPIIEALGETITSTYEESDQSFNNDYIPTPSTPDAPPNIQTPPTPPKIYTEQEVFEFGYDKSHLDMLGELRGIMLEGNFISAGDPMPLNTMQDAIKFQDKFADYLEQDGTLSKAEIDRYRNAYRVLLPELWRKELAASKNSSQSSALPNIWNKFQRNLAKKKIDMLMAEIRKIIPSANAQTECYREGSPNLVRGSQRAAPCCNCTIFKVIPIGCLNRVCAGLPAIWDSATGICGCYI